MSTVFQDLLGPIDRAWLAIRRHWSRPERGEPRSVELPLHGPVAVATAYDFTGDTCLRTNLLTKMALDHCAPGAVLEIASDNLASVETIPFMLPGHGCAHLATVRTPTGWAIYARKERAGKCSS